MSNTSAVKNQTSSELRSRMTPRTFSAVSEIIPTAPDGAKHVESTARNNKVSRRGTTLANCGAEKRMQVSHVEKLREWVHIVQSEFAEMPGLQLSKRQAQRLWNLDAEIADVLFDSLEAAHFLRRTHRDLYIRFDVGC